MIYPSFSGGGLSGFDSAGFGSVGFGSVGFGVFVLVGVGSAGFGVGDGSSVAGTGVDVIVTVGVILGSVPLVGSGVVVSAVLPPPQDLCGPLSSMLLPSRKPCRRIP